MVGAAIIVYGWQFAYLPMTKINIDDRDEFYAVTGKVMENKREQR